MTIGQVAKQSGVGVETIRFYQKQGLIPEPPRPPNGFRKYPVEVIRKIRFIRSAKDLGFSLKDIAELMSFRNQEDPCCDVKRMAGQKLAEIRTRIASFQRLAEALDSLIQECDQGTGGCSILDFMDSLEPS